MPDQTAQTANTAQPSTSEPATMPPEAPQAPASESIPPLAKDDNLTPATLESQPIETAPDSAEATPGKQTDEIPPAPEQNPKTNPAPEIPATPPETGTAQIPPTEPLGSVNEPKVSETEPIFSPTPAEPVSPKPNLVRQLLSKARESIQLRKRKKIDHIMSLFAKRTNITNNQVADFLHVSDATATRYLEQLEKEGKIKQVGKTGKGVKYEKI